jgi:septal ring factor EnvC (AmiA/AmiB activator)
MEIMQAIQLMNAPAPPAAPTIRENDGGVTKLVVGGICAMLGAIILALIFWVGSSVNGLGTTVTKMSANVDQLQKSIADLQQTQGTATQQLSDIRTANARQDARHDAVEAEIKRMKERIRIVEGQPPLRGDTGDM